MHVIWCTLRAKMVKIYTEYFRDPETSYTYSILKRISWNSVQIRGFGKKKARFWRVSPCVQKKSPTCSARLPERPPVNTPTPTIYASDYGTAAPSALKTGCRRLSYANPRHPPPSETSGNGNTKLVLLCGRGRTFRHIRGRSGSAIPSPLPHFPQTPVSIVMTLHNK
ncbi:hypothetical protein L873DRAFT_431605 [Choiromyces venosus 120613-1]|uniref:Uncharacterized protein n=1 Tax=Choiromyces venosus 120613-1 TaxID=1336337 RepID=A0A3N4J1W6_9PEZI|nr:hypothetical protein L873DRAFT_431605 [Choiromyces venosus 120613-1]